MESFQFSCEQEGLVAQYLDKAHGIVYCMVHGGSSDIDTTELLAAAEDGLMKAAQRYNSENGEFWAYAYMKVKWAVLDKLRALHPVSRYYRRILEQKHAVCGSNGEIGRSELLRKLGLSEIQLKNAEIAAANAYQRRFDEPYCHDGNMTLLDITPSGEDPIDDKIFLSQRIYSVLARATEILSWRERFVLELYYLEDLNLEEIGVFLSVSASRISKMCSNALKKLRDTFEMPGDEDDSCGVKLDDLDSITVLDRIDEPKECADALKVLFDAAGIFNGQNWRMPDAKNALCKKLGPALNKLFTETERVLLSLFLFESFCTLGDLGSVFDLNLSEKDFDIIKRTGVIRLEVYLKSVS